VSGIHQKEGREEVEEEEGKKVTCGKRKERGEERGEEYILD